jgi:hypothetical protein
VQASREAARALAEALMSGNRAATTAASDESDGSHSSNSADSVHSSSSDTDSAFETNTRLAVQSLRQRQSVKQGGQQPTVLAAAATVRASTATAAKTGKTAAATASAAAAVPKTLRREAKLLLKALLQ